MIKIRPSEIVPSVGESNTGYFSNCYRFIAFGEELLDEIPFPDLYTLLGASGELFMRGLVQAESKRGTKFEFEQPIKLEISDGVTVSGRVDIMEITKTDTIIHEVKTSLSDSLRSKVEAGTPSQNHVAQLVTYLLMHELTIGKLHVLFPVFSKNGIDFSNRFMFNIEIVDTDIIINGSKYLEFDVTHITGAMRNLVHAKTENETLPKQSLNQFACKGCPFNRVCVDHNPETRDAFREIFNEVGAHTSKPRPLPKLFGSNYGK